MHGYIYIHMQIYVHIHICIYICICTHVYIYLHNSCMRAYLYMYIYYIIYIYINICIYIYLYIYIYIFAWGRRMHTRDVSRELEARAVQLQCPENRIQSIGCCPSTRGAIGRPLPVHPRQEMRPRRAVTCFERRRTLNSRYQTQHIVCCTRHHGTNRRTFFYLI